MGVQRVSEAGPKLGLQTAVGALMERGEAGDLARRAEQLSLLPSDAALGDVAASDEAAQRHGPGRPAGSRNRRTDEWMEFILARYRSPLVFLAEAYTRPVAQLASELACTREEAFKLQVTAARELAPYLHQKQPVAVNVSGSGVVSLVIEAPELGAVQPRKGDDALVVEAAIVTEGNQ